MSNTEAKRSYLLPITMIAILFAVFGFAAWLNSILIPYFQVTLELNDLQTTLVTFSFFVAYVVMALPASFILKKIGFRSGMVVGLIIMILGVLLFLPAAYYRTYNIFLGGLFLMGAGQAILQTAANPYVTILGPNESAGRRNSIMGIANKLAGIGSQFLLGPILLLNMDAIALKVKLLSDAEKATLLDNLALRVVEPYLWIAFALVVITLLIWFVKLPAVQEEDDNKDESGINRTSVWMFPNLILGVLALFCAEGTEAITSYYIIPYGQSMGFSIVDAQSFVNYIIYAMLLGYLCGTLFIPKYIKQDKALKLCALLGMAFSIGAIVTSGGLSVTFIILMGFCNALNWPCIWPLALKGLGKHTKIASAFLIMAIAGGAILPPVYAQINTLYEGNSGVLLLLVLYIIIFLYASVGHKISTWKFSRH